MPKIIVTLLNTRRNRVVIDSMDTTVATQPGGMVVVAGEHLATRVEVYYPEEWNGGNCYVHMKNAKGEYATARLIGGNPKYFDLPNTMTFAGNTFLTFHSEVNDTVGVWVPVVVPVTETGVDYDEVARCSMDLVQETLGMLDEYQEYEDMRRENETIRRDMETERMYNENQRKAEATARNNEWAILKPQMEQIIADSQSAQEAADRINAIYAEFQITLGYDEEGYPCLCYAE